MHNKTLKNQYIIYWQLELQNDSTRLSINKTNQALKQHFFVCLQNGHPVMEFDAHQINKI